MNPDGEILVQSRRHEEDFLTVEIDPSPPKNTAWGLTRSAWSWREFHAHVEAAMKTTSD